MNDSHAFDTVGSDSREGMKMDGTRVTASVPDTTCYGIVLSALPIVSIPIQLGSVDNDYYQV